jgi:hypothetical protein
MKNKVETFLLAVLFLLVVFTGCSTPRSIARSEGMPLWTLKTPNPTLQELFFTGTGSGSVRSEAILQATADLLEEVSQFLRYSVTEAFIKELSQTYAADDIALEIIDEHERRNAEGGITVYLLASADRRMLSAMVRSNIETSRSESQLIEQTLRQAETAYNRSNDYAALGHYLKAAALAQSSSSAAARGQYIRIMNTALEIVRSFVLTEISSSPAEGTVTLALTRGDRLFAPKISGAQFIAEFPVRTADGTETTALTRLTTGNDGQMRFSTNHPGFGGRGSVTIRLDADAMLGELERTVGSDDPLLQSMQEAASRVVRQFAYAVVSPVTGNRLALSLLEFDQQSQLVQNHPGMDSMTAVFESAGYNISPIVIDVINFSGLTEYSEEEALEQMVSTYRNLVSVGVVGTAGITALVPGVNGYIATAKGSVKAVRLSDRSTVAQSGMLVANGTGKTPVEAAEKALGKFGELASSSMLSRLR